MMIKTLILVDQEYGIGMTQQPTGKSVDRWLGCSQVFMWRLNTYLAMETTGLLNYFQ